MDEQATGSDQHSPISSSSVVALAMRFTVSALESSGDERAKHLADVIKRGPELLGQKVGPYLKHLLDKNAQGQTFNKEDQKIFAETLGANPQEAAAYLGYLTADMLEGTLDAASERKAILESYSSVFDIICAYMAKTHRSLALKGFVHDEDCISYWHFERSNLRFDRTSESLGPNGLQVYLLHEEPTLERIVTLNLQINDDPCRHLPSSEFNIYTNDKASKVTEIFESSLFTLRLDPDRENKPHPRKDPLFGGVVGIDYNKPIEMKLYIPPGSQFLIGLIDSLQNAKDAQDYRLLKQQDVARKLAVK